MRSGPRPKPAELKVLAGNPGKRRLPKQKAKPAAGAVAPEWLTPYARKEWERIAALLKPLGLLTDVDVIALAAYCEAVSIFRKATEEIEKDGITTEAGNGTTIPYPAVQIQRSAMKVIREFAVEFGLSPASRAGLDIPGKLDAKNDDDEFFGPRPVPTPPPLPKAQGRKQRR